MSELFDKYIPNKDINKNQVIKELPIAYKSIVLDCMRVIFSNGFDFNHKIWYIDGSSVSNYKLYMGTADYGYVSYVDGDDYGTDDIEFKKLINILNNEYGVGKWSHFVFPVNIKQSYWEYMKPMVVLQSDFVELSFRDVIRQVSGFKYRCWRNVDICIRHKDKGMAVPIYDIISDKYMSDFIITISGLSNSDVLDTTLNSIFDDIVFKTTIRTWYSRVLKVSYRGSIYFMQIVF